MLGTAKVEGQVNSRCSIGWARPRWTRSMHSPSVCPSCPTCSSTPTVHHAPRTRRDGQSARLVGRAGPDQTLFLLGFAPEHVAPPKRRSTCPSRARKPFRRRRCGRALDASNLVGGPVEERLLNVLGKIAPRMERPFLAAVGRVLGREAPRTVDELSGALVDLCRRTGMSRLSCRGVVALWRSPRSQLLDGLAPGHARPPTSEHQRSLARKAAIQVSGLVVDCFGQVLGLDLIASGQIGDGTADAQDAVVSASREAEAVDRARTSSLLARSRTMRARIHQADLGVVVTADSENAATGARGRRLPVRG